MFGLCAVELVDLLPRERGSLKEYCDKIGDRAGEWSAE